MRQGSLLWFARHELRLAWRDAAAMLRGGRRGRGAAALVALAVFVAVLHGVAYASLGPAVAGLAHPDKGVLLLLTGSALLAWMLILSQAVESVTRAFYARADLDLVLSSPAPARRLFSVRLAANALVAVAMAVILVGPAVDVLAWLGGPRFLMGYGVLVAMALSATAVAAGLVTLMFRLCGPARTRLAAQIVAAVLGAGFVVAIQVGAILSYGTLSRSLLLRSPRWIAAAPGLDSPVWWPARAALGAGLPLAAILATSLVLVVAAIAGTATALAAGATRSCEADARRGPARATRTSFRRRSAAGALRMKELTLLRRDPWLVSQSLMQVLYLVPPAFLLWRDYGSDGDGLVVLVPILVMAAGQLAGGLAWLAISGEDAPDLVATAPVPARAVLRAKVEAVALAVALPVVPIVLALAFARPFVAAVTLGGAACATAGAGAVQYVFRKQAKRSNFRRRQTSSRFATFAEAFLSIAFAGASALAAAHAWAFAAGPVAIAALILLALRFAGPTREATA